MDYMKELNVAITVCDKEGKILQMNDKSQMTNHGDLVGQNVLDCHPEPARTKLVQWRNMPRMLTRSRKTA